MKMMKNASLCALICTGAVLFTACSGAGASSTPTAPAPTVAKEMTMEELIAKAKEEGTVVSVGMPDSWANWEGTWKDLSDLHGLKHTDTDMSSAEEIAKMEAEKDKPTVDIGDVGIAFGPIAVTKGVTQPYKTSYWDEIPDWAKDKEGHWLLGYTGTISIISNNKLVKNPPKSWNDLLEGDYKIAIGDVGKAAQANSAVVAAALAMGGDEKNIDPAIQFFGKLAEAGRLSTSDPSLANLESGEVEVAIMWDFNALNYRDKLGSADYTVAIPTEGSVVSGYATIINKYAPHPNTAKLTREYILSDAGQINLAKGYARPIRSSVALPAEVQAKMLPLEQYAKVKPIADYEAWNKTTETLQEIWQSNVLSKIK